MTTHSILIVEDEPKLAQLLGEYLEAADYQINILHHGNDVMPDLAKNNYDLILLDIMLPGIDGISLCKKIRSQSQVPIIMQTARVDEIDRLLGLEIGADDYICKPYSPKEVVARVKAVLRRSHTQEIADDEQLRLDETRLKVFYQGQELELTSVEFALLHVLYQHRGQIFSRDQLIQRIYKDHRVVSDRTVDSHIKKLRKKLCTLSQEHEFIYSVYGAGYKYET